MQFKIAAAILLSFVCVAAASQNCFRKLGFMPGIASPPPKQCEKEGCEYCLNYSTFGWGCGSCKYSYFLDKTTYKCAKCIANCVLCYDNVTCNTCFNTFYGAKCDQKCLTGCKTCTNDQACTSCDDGLWGTVCEKKCITGCQVCKDEQSCEICNDGLFGTVCDQKCINGCKTCKDDKTCEICTSRTQEFINGKCQAAASAASGLIFGAFLLLLSLMCY